MTNTESLVPEGKRLTNLTVAELDYASKRLGVNALTALTPNDKTGEPHPRREMALAVIALVWARRKDPAAKLETYSELELADLMPLLGMNRDAAEEPLNVDPDDPSRSPSG